MIRAIRPSAMAQDDAGNVSGWNVSPNLAYVLHLLPGGVSCAVLLYDEGGAALIASGAALTGTDQPCILIPHTGKAVGMIDAELGWHLLLTTTGAESQRSIRLGPAVDLPDEIHPVYGEDDLALARATAAIDAAAHYIDDMTGTCPLGLGAGLGDVVSVPVDAAAVVGQVESITWTGTPDGASEQAVVRRHVAIVPSPAVAPPTPPAVADDTGETDAATTTSGNVLTNDETGLTVVAVNGLSSNVGQPVAGSDGGTFTIASNGAWAFDPDGDFAALPGPDTAETSVTYHASDGVAEAMATLTVTVSSGAVLPSDPYWDQIAIFLNANGQGTATPSTDLVGNTITYSGGAVIDSVAGYPAFYFDGINDFLSIPAPSGGWGLNNQYTLDWYAYTDTNNKLGGINIGRYQAFGGWHPGSTFSIRDSLNPPLFYFYGSGFTQEGYNSWARATIANTLYHFALVRDGSVAKFYINGILTWTRTGLTLCVESTLSFILGKWDYVDAPEWVRVRIPWLRLTRAIRWTENFIPPDRLIST